MARPVEHVDGRLDGLTEAAHDFAGVALFEEREVRVDLVDLAAQSRRGTLPGASEVSVDLTGRELPRHRAVELTDLHHRLDEPIQRRRCQASGIPRPLILRQRVEEEALLVLRRDACLPAPLERDDVREPALD
jgi:hypothetical protein